MAAVGLAGCAAVGLFLGVTKAAPAGADSRTIGPGLDGVPIAKALAGGGAGLDEATVRKIARDEAQATYAKGGFRRDAAQAAGKHADQPATAKLAKADTSAGTSDAASPTRLRRKTPKAEAPDTASATSEPKPAPPVQPPAPTTPPDQY